MGIRDRRVFALLSLLSPFIDYKHHHYHIDHVFPKSRFTATQLRRVGIADENVMTFADCADRIGNLQLLDGPSNVEKQATLPAKWIVAQYPDEDSRRHYRERYFLGDIPQDITGFMEFYEARRERLQERIAELVNSV